MPGELQSGAVPATDGGDSRVDVQGFEPTGDPFNDPKVAGLPRRIDGQLAAGCFTKELMHQFMPSSGLSVDGFSGIEKRGAVLVAVEAWSRLGRLLLIHLESLIHTKV